MMADDALRALTTKFQTTELNVRREYFQHLFLSYFYQQPGTDQIQFKGGTALRLLYNSPRFSEDLDFSASVRTVHAIEDAIVETLSAIARENIPTNLTNSTRTGGGYRTTALVGTGPQPVGLQLEISLRTRPKQGQLMTVASDLVPPYTLLALERDQLIAEILQALLTRHQARDLCDLYFILRANLLPPTQKRCCRKRFNCYASRKSLSTKN